MNIRNTLLLAFSFGILITLAWPSAAKFVVNARAGCWPWLPKIVDYYPGMTICPGQSARGMYPVPSEVLDSIFREYEHDNPGKSARDMPRDEFRRRVADKIAVHVTVRR